MEASLEVSTLRGLVEFPMTERRPRGSSPAGAEFCFLPRVRSRPHIVEAGVELRRLWPSAEFCQSPALSSSRYFLSRRETEP